MKKKCQKQKKRAMACMVILTLVFSFPGHGLAYGGSSEMDGEQNTGQSLVFQDGEGEAGTDACAEVGMDADVGTGTDANARGDINIEEIHLYLQLGRGYEFALDEKYKKTLAITQNTAEGSSTEPTPGEIEESVTEPVSDTAGGSVTEESSATEQKPAEEKPSEESPGDTPLEADALNPDIDTVLSSVRSHILKYDTDPDFNSIWHVIGLTRSGLSVPKSYTDTFYQNVIAYLDSKDWVLTRTKYSDYSKLIIAMTAIGKDARDIAGHNLLGYLSDFSNITRQGYNGPVWALMALKSHPSYTIPTDPKAEKQVTEEGLIEYILEQEKQAGGWTLTGDEPDSDMTGMTIQALSSYYGVREDVTAAVDRALSWLSNTQLPSGGYATMGAETEESVCQVITALCSVAVDCAKDSRFVKNGKWPMTGLFQYYLPEGGFMHVAAGAANNGGGEGGTLNGMSTEQGLYATVAYKRLLEGKNFLYHMGDISIVKGERPKTPANSTKKEEETTASGKVKVMRLALDYSMISVEKGKSRTLKVTVTPKNASNQKVKWTSSNQKVASVSQKGKVTGKKAGTAKITVTAADGSEKKASCTVKVKDLQKAASSTKTPVRATGQTKSLSGRTTAAAGQTKSLSGSSASGSETADTSKEAGSGAGGWSFDGEEYIPESGADSDDFPQSGEDAASTDRKSTFYDESQNPVAYMLMGGGGLGTAQAVWWIIRRRAKMGKGKGEGTT